MNKLVVVAIALGLAACQPTEKTNTANQTTSENATTDTAMTFTSDDDKASYAIGFSGGDSMKRELSELNVDTFVRGFKDGFKGAEPAMSKEEMGSSIQALQTRKMEEMKQKADKDLVENKAAGEKFLAENTSREGVITLESGLQYEVVNKGEGDSPTKDDTVKVHYHGTLIDGTVFDSSVERGQPATFGVSQVIKGWTEALQLMKVGDKWKVFIPSDLAYGPRGAGRNIGPNSALIFDVELLEIVKK